MPARSEALRSLAKRRVTHWDIAMIERTRSSSKDIHSLRRHVTYSGGIAQSKRAMYGPFARNVHLNQKHIASKMKARCRFSDFPGIPPNSIMKN